MGIKQIIFLLVFVTIVGNVFGQENSESSALKHAQKMVAHYNAKEFDGYVDLLLLKTYGNASSIVAELTQFFERQTRGDTTQLQIVEVLKTTAVNGQQQAVLKTHYRGDGFIIGISNDAGENWLFTTPMSKEIQFDQVVDEIPTIDPSFADILDPGYGDRIKYEVGKLIAPFDYVDIYGDKLTSSSLQGKVIVLNFWYPSCPPCLKEIPELNAIVERQKDKDVVFIAPAIYTSKEELLNSFLPKHPFSYQMVLIDNQDYSVTSFPTHVLIDQDLRVVDKIKGYSPDTSRQLEEKIEELLKNN